MDVKHNFRMLNLQNEAKKMYYTVYDYTIFFFCIYS